MGSPVIVKTRETHECMGVPLPTRCKIRVCHVSQQRPQGFDPPLHVPHSNESALCPASDPPGINSVLRVFVSFVPLWFNILGITRMGVQKAAMRGSEVTTQ